MKNGGIYQRFNESYKVDKKTGCWNWIGNIGHAGYGQIMFDYKFYRAHRLSYILLKGKIPKGLLVCHSCDNRKCVNPDHLWLGTCKDNLEDMVKKNRSNANEKCGRHKLKNKQVIKIRKMEKSNKEIARIFNVASSTIDRIKKGIIRKNI